ncbi:MAG: helicase-related protein, partial [Candidatus Izemoplasmatales bacterium]
KQASLHHTSAIYEPITSEYSIVKVRGSVKDTVSMVTNLFENRDIDILVGTKSLLGEGWDSPCINTLIMASFVGSYMLSNQMRGRAIRTDRHDPLKVSSIWHLATIEPYNAVKLHWYDTHETFTEYEKEEIVSEDYEMLKRRFKTFLGPAYSTGEISSGIERIDIIEPPFSNVRFQSFNQKTLQIAKDRNQVREMWNHALNHNMTKEVIDASEIKKEFYPTGVIIYDIIPNSVAAALLTRFLSENLINGGPVLFSLILGVLIFFISVKPIKRLLWNNSPKKTIEGIASAVFKTMKKLAFIQSHSAVVHVKKSPLTMGYYAYLEHGTHHEKTLFSNAMTEIFSSIGAAKYITVSYRNFLGVPLYFYESSYTVPAIFSVNKDRAEEYVSYLEDYIGRVELVFTRSESGLSKLLKAQKKSKVNRYNLTVFSKKMLKTDFPKKK